MTEHEDLAKRVSALEKELLEAKKQLEAMKPPEPFVPKREWQRPDYTEGMSMSGPALKPMVDLINPQGLKSDIGAWARNRIGEPGGFGPGPAKQWPKQSSRLLKNVLERSGCARLIQHSGPWRTKDSAPRGPGFENCASLIPSRVFQQPARSASDKDELKIPEPPKSRWSK